MNFITYISNMKKIMNIVCTMQCYSSCEPLILFTVKKWNFGIGNGLGDTDICKAKLWEMEEMINKYNGQSPSTYIKCSFSIRKIKLSKHIQTKVIDKGGKTLLFLSIYVPRNNMEPIHNQIHEVWFEIQNYM